MSRRRCITTDECQKCNAGLQKDLNDVKGDLKTVKEALVGANLMGGLVAHFNDMANTLKGLVSEKTEDKKAVDVARERALRWKIAAVTICAGVIGIFLGYVLNLL